MSGDDTFPEEGIYSELARVGKALASPVRLRLLDLIEEREMTVDDLAAEAGFGVKNTSSQLQILHAASLVTRRRDGTRIYYRIASSTASTMLGQFHGFARNHVGSVRAEIDSYFSDFAALQSVTCDELATSLERGSVLLIDVRSADEFAAGHIPGAVSIPQQLLREQLESLPTGRPVIAYCQGPYCLASPRAVTELRHADIDAAMVRGGITDWIRSGHLLEGQR